MIKKGDIIAIVSLQNQDCKEQNVSFSDSVSDSTASVSSVNQALIVKPRFYVCQSNDIPDLTINILCPSKSYL